MITGAVSWLLEPTVGVDVQDANGILQRFRCVLDTGFDGYIALPATSIQLLGLTLLGRLETTFLDGFSAQVPVYDGIVSWNSEIIEVTVLETQGESVIGMALLENSTLTVQVWDGGEVRIEPRQPSVTNH